MKHETSVIELALKTVAMTCPNQQLAECSGLTIFDKVDDMQPYHCDIPVKPGDLVISFDYWTDELTDQQASELIDWFDENLWNTNSTVDRIMTSLGYKVIDMTDGSGGGLYYGSTLYRK